MGSLYADVDYEAWLADSAGAAAIAVPLILEAVEPASVVDVGCGLGAWLAAFKEHGVDDVLGYDGPWVDRSLLLVAPAEYQVADLNEELPVERRFDLALCLETAHLLERARAAPLVRTLASLADVVLFSAAIPGQGGLGHVNEQWPRYWAELFATAGYVASDPFRAPLWEEPAAKWWFAQNLLCFAAPAALERRPILAAARCAGAPLPLVHPGCLEHVLGAIEQARARPRRRRWGRAAT